MNRWAARGGDVYMLTEAMPGLPAGEFVKVVGVSAAGAAGEARAAGPRVTVQHATGRALVISGREEASLEGPVRPIEATRCDGEECDRRPNVIAWAPDGHSTASVCWTCLKGGQFSIGRYIPMGVYPL